VQRLLKAIPRPRSGVEKAVAQAPRASSTARRSARRSARRGSTTARLTELQKVAESPGYQKADAWIYLGASQLAAGRYPEAAARSRRASRSRLRMRRRPATWLGPTSPEGHRQLQEERAKARTLGYKDQRLLDNLTRVEGGAPIK